MGKLIIFNFILIALIVLGLWLVKKFVKGKRARDIILLLASIFTVIFHYSSFFIRLLSGNGALEYLSETPNLILPIYPCNIVMWSAVIFALIKRASDFITKNKELNDKSTPLGVLFYVNLAISLNFRYKLQ